jgi:lysophospholipase L1-like esterase
MTITLIGDSLTAGNLGIPYSRYLNLNLPDDVLVLNRGLDGDTVQGIFSRLEDTL